MHPIFPLKADHELRRMIFQTLKNNINNVCVKWVVEIRKQVLGREIILCDVSADDFTSTAWNAALDHILSGDSAKPSGIINADKLRETIGRGHYQHPPLTRAYIDKTELAGLIRALSIAQRQASGLQAS